jgi:hypothetical protein
MAMETLCKREELILEGLVDNGEISRFWTEKDVLVIELLSGLQLRINADCDPSGTPFLVLDAEPA